MASDYDATLARAEQLATEWGHAGPALEHMLVAALENELGRAIVTAAGADVDLLLRNLRPLTRHTVVNKRPDNAPWLAMIVQKCIARGLPSGTLEELLSEIMAVKHSGAVGVVVQQGVRRVDVLNVIAHGISKSTGAAPLPTMRLLRGGQEATTGSGIYRVVMHNDAYTTYATAIAILMEYFDKIRGEAIDIAKQVHRDGRGVAGRYAIKLASKRLAKATKAAHELDCPLLLSLEPDET